MWFFVAPVVLWAGKKVYDAATESESSSSSNRIEVEENYNNQKEKENKKDLNEFRKKSKKQIREKYNTRITFNNTKVSIVTPNIVLENNISDLEKETNELKSLLKFLNENNIETSNNTNVSMTTPNTFIDDNVSNLLNEINEVKSLLEGDKIDKFR